jgi:hypothetical protein
MASIAWIERQSDSYFWCPNEDPDTIIKEMEGEVIAAENYKKACDIW